jgi:hypothetical protein
MRSGLDTGQLDRRVEEAHPSQSTAPEPLQVTQRSLLARTGPPTTLGRSGEAFREAPGGPEGFLNTRSTLIADPRQPDCSSPSILARETLRPSHAPSLCSGSFVSRGRSSRSPPPYWPSALIIPALIRAQLDGFGAIPVEFLPCAGPLLFLYLRKSVLI